MSTSTPPKITDPRQERLIRAYKARADYLSKPFYDSAGTMQDPGVSDPMEAVKLAVSDLPTFLKNNPNSHQPWRDYLDGKSDQIPTAYAPRAISLQERQTELTAIAREQKPWLAAGTDALNTVGSLGEGFVQGVADMATGAANLIPGVTVPRVDVKASLRAFALNHVPWLKEQGKTFTVDETRRELDATKDSANGLTQVAELAGQGTGSMFSMIGTGGTSAIGKVATVTSAPFRASMKLGDGIGKVLGKGTGMAITEKSGKLAKLISEGTGKVALAQSAGAVLGSAAGIAADKALKAGTTQDAATGQERKTTLGERAGEAGTGALEGAAFGLLGEFGKAAFRSMFKTPLSKLGTDEKNAVTALADWAKQNKLFQVGRETSDAYSKRILNAYVEAGFPGAPRMYGRQILGRAMQGGIEGLGFSALDEKFHRDLFEGAFQGDTQALKRALISYGAGVFQTMAMHGPLKDIPRGQRRMDFTPTGEAPKPQEPVKTQEPSAPQQPAPKPDLPKGGALEAGKSSMEGDPAPATINAGTLDVGRQPKPDAATGTILGGQPSLQRFGWIRNVTEPAAEIGPDGSGPVTGFDPSVTEAQKAAMPREPETMTLPGTKMGFEVDGDVARPTKALRDALGVPTELPVAELTQAIEGASVMSALVAKEQLPGELISADGIVAVPDADGVMRTVRLGEVLESPLSPTPEWVPAKSFPARGKDPIPQEQSQVVEILTDIVNNRQDLPEHTRAMLSKAADVMDTVSLHNDEAVAETMGVMQDLVPIIAQGTPEQAAKAVQALGESLTVKHPEIALRDMAGPQEPVQKAPPRGDDNPDGYGPAQVGMGVPVPPELVRMVGSGGASWARTAWKALHQTKTQRATERAGKDIGDIGRAWEAKQSEYEGRLNKEAVGTLLRTPRKVLDRISEEIVDADGYGTTLYAVKRDAGLAKHFGKGRKLDDKEAVVEKQGENLQYETARLAEENKVEFLNADEGGPQGITANRDRKRLVRIDTPEWTVAKRKQSGELWDAMVKWHEKHDGWTPEKVAKHYSEQRRATKTDATQYLRIHDTLPTRVPTKSGRRVKIFEDTPLEHSLRMAHTSSHVMASHAVREMIDALPEVVKQKDGQELDKWGGDNVVDAPVPASYQKLLDVAETRGGRVASQATADMVRAMHGMSIHGTPTWMGDPGSAKHTFGRFIMDLVGLAKVAKLPLSFMANVPEAMADVPFLTLGGVMGGYRKVFEDFVSLSGAETYRRMVAEGWTKDATENLPTQGNDAFETLSLNLEKAKSLIMTPVRIAQGVNEMVKIHAARERLQAMREGNGATADLNALRLLEFDAETAMRMVDGKGTEAEYARYRSTIIGTLSGGKAQHGTMRSHAADSKFFNAVVWFTGYFQTRMRAMDSLSARLVDAKGAEKVEAGVQMLSAATFTMLSGAVGTILAKALRGEAGDYLREETDEESGYGAKAALKLLVSGTFGGLGTPIMESLSKIGGGENSEKILAEQIARSVPLVGVVGDAADLLLALGGNDVPGYSGKSKAGMVSKYIQEFTPVAKALHRGLFGISALAITEHDPALDAANRSLWRWMADNPDYAKGGFTSKESTAEFRSAMSKVVDRVMSGDSWTDDQLVDALMEAEMAAQDEADKAGEKVTMREIRNRVAESLRKRKTIPPKMPQAVQESFEDHLGADHIQTLQDYDRVLEAMARHVSPTRRF